MSTSDSKHAPLQALSPTVSRPSSGTLAGLEPAKPNVQTSNQTPHLHHSLPDLLTKNKRGHYPAPHIHNPSPGLSASASSSPSIPWKEQHQEPRQIILGSFAPRVAVYTSSDIANFIKLKGFNEGLRGILRPFGERIQGKVVIRDSVGASRGWHDFGIKFIDPFAPQSFAKWENNDQTNETSDMRNANFDYDPTALIDKVIGYHLGSETEITERESKSVGHSGRVQSPPTLKQPVHTLYLQKLLSSTPIVPYETFAHPVACVIAISSGNSTLLETLHQMYDNTVQDGNRSPPWINTEYLRYYVLVHDEDNDDITKSTALFDLMKRHFGLHCHLLRLRRSQCVATDDDSVQVPSCEWLTAEEELAQISRIGRLARYPSSLIVCLPLKIFLMVLRTKECIYTNLTLLQLRTFFARW